MQRFAFVALAFTQFSLKFVLFVAEFSCVLLEEFDKLPMARLHLGCHKQTIDAQEL